MACLLQDLWLCVKCIFMQPRLPLVPVHRMICSRGPGSCMDCRATSRVETEHQAAASPAFVLRGLDHTVQSVIGGAQAGLLQQSGLLNGLHSSHKA